MTLHPFARLKIHNAIRRNDVSDKTRKIREARQILQLILPCGRNDQFITSQPQAFI